MKTRFLSALTVLLVLALFVPAAQADFLGEVLKKGLEQLPAGAPPQGGASSLSGLDEATIASGLKEALSVGTRNAVGVVSRLNGYYGNEAIRILLPQKVQTAAEILGKIGYQKQVDDFIQSMNRAAERAAPRAAAPFADALRGMTIEDARSILAGGKTSATDYFKAQTAEKLYESFKPQISETMSQVGVARFYGAMMAKVPATLFAHPQSLELDHYVTVKALDGLFAMLAQEELRIRENPAARTTDLLKKVFAR
jgi:ribosomal protein L22